MSCDLANRKCIPCTGTIPPLPHDQQDQLIDQLGNSWQLIDRHHLEKSYKFKNFKEALAFTNLAGEVAEQANHHPEIVLNWGRVDIRIWTHKIDGLTESDFILAAKIDAKLDNA